MNSFYTEKELGELGLKHYGKNVLISKKYAQIGTGSAIMPAVIINNGVAVGTMSLVNKNLDEWGIYAEIPDIRQAIEGVLMQKTALPVELVIGEDCSTGHTRKICLEYKEKYPDKIKLLLPEKFRTIYFLKIAWMLHY